MSNSAARNGEDDSISIKAAKDILSNREGHNCELWSRLAGACSNAQAHRDAVDCAMSALSILESPGSITCMQNCPELEQKDWYWLAVAEISLGKVGIL